MALTNLVDELPFAFRESCYSSCVSRRSASSGTPTTRGGSGTRRPTCSARGRRSSAILELLDGDAPAGAEETVLAERIRDAAALIAVADAARRSA